MLRGNLLLKAILVAQMIFFPAVRALAEFRPPSEVLIQAEREAEERRARIENMKKEAQKLVRDYNDAVIKRFRSIFVSEELEAVREITAIKNRRDEMRKMMEQMSLPTRDREEIQAILSQIP